MLPLLFAEGNDGLAGIASNQRWMLGDGFTWRKKLYICIKKQSYISLDREQRPQYLTDDLFKISEVARRRAPQSNTMLILQHCKVVYLITDYCFRIAEGRQLKR